mgnify:CR=1 FL=1|jgi:hypothetical protein
MGQIISQLDISDFKIEFGNMADEFLYVDWDGSISTLLLKIPIIITITIIIYTIYLINVNKRNMRRLTRRGNIRNKNTKIILSLLITSIVGTIYILYSYNYIFIPEKINWRKKLLSNNKAKYLYYNIGKQITLSSFFKIK